MLQYKSDSSRTFPYAYDITASGYLRKRDLRQPFNHYIELANCYSKSINMPVYTFEHNNIKMLVNRILEYFS